MKRRSFLAMITALAGSGAMSGCSSDGKTAPSDSLLKCRYAAPLTLAAAPAYVAWKKGFWANHGLALDLQLFDSGRQALDALLGGQADFMSVSETPPMAAVVRGSELYWIGTAARHSEAKFTYRSDRIADPSDLVGATIGSQPGTNSDFLLHQWLVQNSIDVAELTVVPLNAPDMVQALIQGDVDGIFAWEPHNYNAYSRMGSLAVNASDMPYRGYHCLIASPPMAEESNHATAVAFLAGLRDAEDFMAESPDESRAIVSTVTGMDAGTLAALWPEYRFVLEMPEDLASLLDEQSQWLIESGDATAPVPDFTSHIRATAINEVL